jgi:Protein of unknown function (DUF2000)
MSYQNNEKKFAAVLNRRQPLPLAFNALAHAACGISGRLGTAAGLLRYPNDATGFEARISEFPFIVLEARNSAQLALLLESAMADGELTFNAFTRSMVGTSAAAQQAATAAASREALDFVAVVLFGPREKVDALTRKFSLLKGWASPATADVST